jgi:hypothetical protein
MAFASLLMFEAKYRICLINIGDVVDLSATCPKMGQGRTIHSSVA